VTSASNGSSRHCDAIGVVSKVVPADYDEDPDRWQASRRATERYGTAGDTHEPVATRLVGEGLGPVLDVGCGDGRLRDALPDGQAWVGVDESPAQVALAPRPVVRADAAALPVRTASCGAVAALYVLYHLDEPSAAVAEARRVLRPGGLFVACTTRRDDDPELHRWFGEAEPSTFDAEEAPAIIGAVFGDRAVEVDGWDGPFVHLADEAAMTEYLRGRGIGAERAAEVAAEADLPLDLTKRGALVWARR
jgi:SAM-dependent methyltransferase